MSAGEDEAVAMTIRSTQAKKCDVCHGERKGGKRAGENVKMRGRVGTK